MRSSSEKRKSRAAEARFQAQRYRKMKVAVLNGKTKAAAAAKYIYHLQWSHTRSATGHSGVRSLAPLKKLGRCGGRLPGACENPSRLQQRLKKVLLAKQ